jgi:transposase
MQDELVFKGVDVAKDELVIATLPTAAQIKLRNQSAVITKWLRTLLPGTFIAMESTGRYHHELARLAVQAGMKVYVLNARDVHFYAKALGKRGKTDASDAQVIARYLAEHHQTLRPWVPGAPPSSVWSRCCAGVP